MIWDSGRPYPQRRAVCGTKQRHVSALHTALVLAGYHADLVDDETDGLAIEVYLPDASDSFLFVSCRQIGRHWRFRAGRHLPDLGVAEDIDATVRRLRDLIGPPPRPIGHPSDGEVSA